jgi:hypothetical protein
VAISEAMRRELFHKAEPKRFRIGRLFDTVTLTKEPEFEQDRAILLHISRVVLQLLSIYISMDVDGEKVAQIYRSLDLKLAAESSTNRIEQHLDSTDASEQCSICKAIISFDSIHTARCANGHEFGNIPLFAWPLFPNADLSLARCQLTFLAIQAPGISKYCGVCGKKFLSEEWVRSKISVNRTDGNTPTGRQTPSLVSLMIDSCDVCVYCGGKFVN